MSTNTDCGPYKVTVLHDGYSKTTENVMLANCTCTLIQGSVNIIVDTMTSWDKDKIITALAEHKIHPNDINYVVSTHGHSDHVGNNNLFLKAKHIVGFSISFKDTYFEHDFVNNVPFVIDEYVKVVPTPGHTKEDVSVIIENVEKFGTIAVTGDLFEKEEDLDCEEIWVSAGSQDKESQKKFRSFILNTADWIIPGHGKMFQVKKKEFS